MDVMLGLGDSDWAKVGQVVAEVHDHDGRVALVKKLLTAQVHPLRASRHPLVLVISTCVSPWGHTRLVSPNAADRLRASRSRSSRRRCSSCSTNRPSWPTPSVTRPSTRGSMVWAGSQKSKNQLSRLNKEGGDT